MGGFGASVLTDDRGLALASAAEAGREPQAQATVVALVEQAAARVADQPGMSGTEEVAVADASGWVLVCRRTVSADRRFLLSMVLPDRRRRYRRLTNRAVQSLQRILGYL